MNSLWNPWSLDAWSAPEKAKEDHSLPLITLGVLSFNRCADLRRTLDVLTHGIRYPRYEILVIDNGSTDGSCEMIAAEYPSVRLHQLERNYGTSSRNIQTQLAAGKYLFSFDDDSFPGTPSTILQIVRHMESYPSIDAISMSCYQPRSGIMETKGWEFFRRGGDPDEGFEGIFIAEGGICFRLDSLRKVEGYDRSFVYGSEGMDLGLQLYKVGCKIVLCPSYLTLHFVSSAMRPNGFRTYANSRHMVWMIAKHWPMIGAIPLFVCLIFRRAVGMLMHPKLTWESARGLVHGFRGVRPFLQRLPKLTFGEAVALRRFYLFLFRWG